MIPQMIVCRDQHRTLMTAIRCAVPSIAPVLRVQTRSLRHTQQSSLRTKSDRFDNRPKWVTRVSSLHHETKDFYFVITKATTTPTILNLSRKGFQVKPLGSVPLWVAWFLQPQLSSLLLLRCSAPSFLQWARIWRQKHQQDNNICLSVAAPINDRWNRKFQRCTVLLDLQARSWCHRYLKFWSKVPLKTPTLLPFFSIIAVTWPYESIL